MLMSLVQWTLHRLPIHPSQYLLWTQRPLYFWNCDSNSAFFTWEMSIIEAKWTLFFVFCATFITSCCFWLSPTAKLEQSQAFSILYPLLPSHPEFSSPAAIGWICAPRCNATLNFVLCLQCDLQDLLSLKITVLVLWIHEPVSPEPVDLDFLLQGMAVAMGVSNFLSNSWHCRISVSRLSILVLLYFERLSQSWTTLQTTHDLVE